MWFNKKPSQSCLWRKGYLAKRSFGNGEGGRSEDEEEYQRKNIEGSLFHLFRFNIKNYLLMENENGERG
jgi:hypothetical protein